MAAIFIHPYFFSWQKRAFDLVFAVCLIFLGWPILLSLFILQRMIMGSPVIFSQKRTGQKGSVFTLYKLRTMYLGAEKQQWRYKEDNQAPSPMFKINDDPRYRGWGKWLSLSGVDEIPQLWNILKGEMSFVGPRPLPVQEAEQLDSSWQFRTRIRPGVFSAWSASPKRHTTLTTWKSLDAETLKMGSMTTDLQLIFRQILEHFSGLIAQLTFVAKRS